MSAAVGWVQARARGAPPPLLERALWYVREAGGGAPDDPTGAGVPDALAYAASLALGRAASAPGGREIALDLLAADALVTMSLEAQAEIAPAGLVALAERIRLATFQPERRAG